MFYYQDKSKAKIAYNFNSNLNKPSFEDKHFQLMANKTEQNKISQNKKRTRIPFTKEEDERLISLVNMFDIKDKNSWYIIANNIVGRTPRQCRERYQLFLSDNVRKNAKWTKEEDELLLEKYSIFGPHWKKMEQFFEGRTSYNIKNRFISLSRKNKFQIQNEADQLQIIPSILSSPISDLNNTSNILDNGKDIASNYFDIDSFDDFSFFEEESNFDVF